VNPSLIAEVKNSVRCPVIANGDIRDPGDARRLLEATGADGVMIGRGAIGNLWIFRAAAACLAGGALPAKPSAEERLAEFREHLERLVAASGEWTGVRLMRKYAPYYATGVAGGRAFRAAVNTEESSAEVLAMAGRLFRGEAEGVRAADALGVARDSILAVAAEEKAENERDLAGRGE
jgi:tRNA-dihydrouridine synthase B